MRVTRRKLVPALRFVAFVALVWFGVGITVHVARGYRSAYAARAVLPRTAESKALATPAPRPVRQLERIVRPHRNHRPQRGDTTGVT